MLVEGLTKVSLPQDGDRAARKAIDREHTRRACPAAEGDQDDVFARVMTRHGLADREKNKP
ncbi:MAG: hypothetical protein FWD17_14705 [Polyangiaceae bacterium]|nr:hypothetical protein [Polyangiaceae bacterium]